MSSVASPQLLNYAEIVDVDLDATNDVNFADVEDYGHRVIVEMNTAALNDYLGWYRAIGEARPKATVNPLKEGEFKAALEAALGAGYVDIDGVTNGLHFGTANLSTNPDPRIRKNGAVSANDIPLCFVLYKLYGSSAIATLDNIYNMADAYEMLSNATVSAAITESFKTQEAGALDTMFRDLLASDPHRFFDASGLPANGIFETRQDVYGSGNWKLVADDTLEIKIKLIFHSRVTRRGVAGQEHNLTTSAVEDQAASQANQQTIISPEDYFYVRLQLKSTPDASTGSSGSESGGNESESGGNMTLTSFTNPLNDTSSEFALLVPLLPITLTDGVNAVYGPEHNPTAYEILYQASIDEVWLLDGGYPVVKFQRTTGATFAVYFDQYGRTANYGVMKFN